MIAVGGEIPVDHVKIVVGTTPTQDRQIAPLWQFGITRTLTSVRLGNHYHPTESSSGMTRRIVAALIALLLPLADAVQWAACGQPFGDPVMVTMAMEAGASMDPAMPMGDQSAPCASDDASDRNADHEGPCGDAPDNQHGCQASVPCGVAVATVTPTATNSSLSPAVDGAVWRDQFALGTGSVRPEPPPPRS